MIIRRVVANNRRKAFEVLAGGRTYFMPFAKVRPQPTATNPVDRVYADVEIGREGFCYTLQSGTEGVVHIDHVLEYNRDPSYVADMVMYRLTVAVQDRLAASPLGTREVIRRLGTSPAQFYRLLDQTNTKKSVRQMLALLEVLDCEVDFVVRRKKSA